MRNPRPGQPAVGTIIGFLNLVITLGVLVPVFVSRQDQLSSQVVAGPQASLQYQAQYSALTTSVVDNGDNSVEAAIGAFYSYVPLPTGVTFVSIVDGVVTSRTYDPAVEALRIWYVDGIQNLTIDVQAVAEGLDFRRGTESSLGAILFPELLYVGGGCYFELGLLTHTLDLPKLQICNDGFTFKSAFIPSTASSFTHLDMPELQRVGGGLEIRLDTLVSIDLPVLSYVAEGFGISACPQLLELNTPALAYTGGFGLGSGVGMLPAASFPNLVKVAGGFSLSATAITNFSVPLLEETGTLQVSSCNALTSLAFPSLRRVTSTQIFFFNTADALLTLDMPVFEDASTAPTFRIQARNLVTLNMPALVQTHPTSSILLIPADGTLQNLVFGTVGVTKRISSTLTISNQALTEASVNRMLSILVSLDGTNGTTLWGAGHTVNLSGGTSAAPTGQGIVDAGILTGRGATVTTN